MYKYDIVFGEEDCKKRNDQLIAFERIYNDAFPNTQEREDFQGEIMQRLRFGDFSTIEEDERNKLESKFQMSLDEYPQTIAYLMYADEDKKILAGGLIADWYPQVQSLELIYMVVNPNLRWNKDIDQAERPHYGRTMLQEGTKAICERLGQNPFSIYTFFEAENPFHKDNATCRQQTIDRLKFFSQCGGRRLPIPYVQPPLDSTEEYAENLYLFVLLLEEDEREEIPYKQLQGFLSAFYKGLRYRTPEKGQTKFDEKLKTLLQFIKEVADGQDNVPFDLLNEEPFIKLEKVAVATHYEIQFDEKVLAKYPYMTPAWMAQETETSRNWGSYESDLFNYHNQENPPFATHLATTAPFEGWTLPLPQIYTYTSEGRTYCKLSARSSAQVDVSISWSVRESHGKKVRIAHLALTPSEGDFLWEHELIKIIAGLGFGSHQEHFTMLSEERQRFDNFFMEALNQAMPWPDTGIGECPERKFIILNNGITEINLNGRICKIDEIDKSGKSRKKRVPKWTSYRRKVRCGILLGIFDFNRMSAVEADVTLNPIVEFPSEEMVYYASRGHLLRIMKRFKDEEENLQNLLISPYLVIPSAAICFNELLLQRASQDLPKKGIGFGSVSPVKRILSADFLTDIFQYESEKRLLNRIMVGRSLLQDRSKLLERSSLIQTKTTHFLEALQATTLAAIALLQVYGFFEDCPVRFWVIFGIVIIGFIWYSIHRLRQ